VLCLSRFMHTTVHLLSSHHRHTRAACHTHHTDTNVSLAGWQAGSSLVHVLPVASVSIDMRLPSHVAFLRQCDSFSNGAGCSSSHRKKYFMAFIIDCDGRHGLISIENKPASYGAIEWKCKACNRRISANTIGVLNCERCRCDICPDCWTVLLPNIMNASGYPCFWREVRPPHTPTATRMLGCHRHNVVSPRWPNGSPAQFDQLCGIDFVKHTCFARIDAVTMQCAMCADKQRELTLPHFVAAAAAFPPAPQFAAATAAFPPAPLFGAAFPPAPQFAAITAAFPPAPQFGAAADR
jgi:hypothetical protein